MELIVSPMFWFAMMAIGVVLLIGIVFTKKTEMLNSTAVAVTISTLIALAYFHIVNHYLMDFQGLDYWYLFRD